MGTKCTDFRISLPPASLVDIERDEGPPPPSPVDALFTATQRRVLACLFGEPGRAFYLRELLALIGGGHGAVQRELRRLHASGLVRATRRRPRVYFQADPSSPVFHELTAMVRKTIGLAEPLRRAFALAESHLRLAFAFEPERDPLCPRERDLGLLLLAGEHPLPMLALDYAREDAEGRLRRGIWMLPVDAARLREEPFIAEVLKRPRTWVFGDERELERARA